ncbi:MAG: phosphate acyltransferase, partial [Gemmatimonadota bacterium]|nr:phosphate acyltransferase [Gemmatimonadota bacterium]
AMKMAATRALAALAKEEVPPSVATLYGLSNVKFGAEYLIPYPFDPRVLLWVAPAVAWAAVVSGAAKDMIDLDAYREQLESRLGRARGIMRGIITRAMQDPKRVVFPEGEDPRIIRAARIIMQEGIAEPVLLGNRVIIEATALELGINLDQVEIHDPSTSPRRDEFARYLWEKRQRKGLSLGEAHTRLYNANYFGSVMVALGHADALVSGVSLHYPETIRPALEVIGAHPKNGLVSGLYMLVLEKHVVFCGDTTVTIDPTAEELAQIAYSASRIVGTFGIEPRIAMLSFSNFGSVRHPEADKVARAVALLRQRDPSLVVDGEMQADTAMDESKLATMYPFSVLKERANVLIFPNLSAGNIAYKLLRDLGGATAIGPILVGMNRPVHVLEEGVDVEEIVNMAAVAVVDAQERR